MKKVHEHSDFEDWAKDNEELVQEKIVEIVSAHPHGASEDVVADALNVWWTDMLLESMADEGWVDFLPDGRVYLTEKGRALRTRVSGSGDGV